MWDDLFKRKKEDVNQSRVDKYSAEKKKKELDELLDSEKESQFSVKQATSKLEQLLEELTNKKSA